MRYRSAAIAGVVGIAVLALVVVFAVSPAGGRKDVRSRVLGSVAPPISGPGLDGNKVDLDSFRGEWVLVNFFASWCPSCITEHPELIKLSKDDGGPIQVVSVGYQDRIEELRKFFVDNGGKWPVLTGDTDELGFEYGVKALPESFLVGPFGQVVAKFEGGITADNVMAYIVKSEAGSDSGSDGSSNSGSGSGASSSGEPSSGASSSGEPGS